MNKVIRYPKLLLLGLVLCFGLLIPHTGVQAASYSTSTKEEKEQSDVKLNVKKKSLVKDSSYTLILYNLSPKDKVTFKSNNSDVASVDQDGVVKALKVGEATITVTVKGNGKVTSTLTCDITVGPPAVSVIFNIGEKTNITLTEGQSTFLDTIIKPNNTVEDVIFSSSNLSIASVSSNGRITAKSAGSCYIFGRINNGQYAKVLIIVEEDKEQNKEKTADKIELKSEK